MGAGPGDPWLLTRRGEEALRRADVVLYDNLTNPDLLKLAREDVEKIYVGKKARQARPDQAWINQKMIDEARAGRVVARLKGGDGFVFGRGGEEAEALLAAGVRYEVVPGVTSATAAPALAGIPVTQRGINTVFHVLVGFEDPDDPSCSVAWGPLARSGGTLVILMGTFHLGAILNRLLREGLAPETPLATVRSASYPTQRSVRTTLGEAAAHPERAYFPPPAITIIGAVAALDERLNWFERRPLFGRRILLTRPEEEIGGATSMHENLAEAGAWVETFGAIRLEPITPPPPLVGELERAREARGWLILPSPAAIRFFFDRLAAEGLDARALAGIRVAVIGSRSAEALARLGVRADFTPTKPGAAFLAAELPIDADVKSRFALIAGSEISRPELAEDLRARGVECEKLTLYSNHSDPAGVGEILKRLAGEPIDAVAVFSPSAARALAEGLNRADAGGGGAGAARWVAIGETTAAAMRAAGLAPAAVAASPTSEGLIQTLVDLFKTE